ncbi:hypothetical protein BC831DRAFT_467704 [Entophlyctis helioformis]|nr:hypothetical protein BC831DRAFT_467704 [Entophlyctis helioformis]
MKTSPSDVCMSPSTDAQPSMESMAASLPSVRKSRYERVLRRAKAMTRSELLPSSGGWGRYGFAASWPSTGPANSRTTTTEEDMVVDRIDCGSVSVAEFVERWEAPGRPVIVRDAASGWAANTEWSIENLVWKYGNTKFKVGQDDEGFPVRMKLKYYLHYAIADEHGAKADDSPLYIFESSFAHRDAEIQADIGGQHDQDKADDPDQNGDSRRVLDTPKSNLLNDYSIPKFFTDDLFKLVGQRRRPPYRWIVIGPPRSGTGVHIDPLGTSAWNTLLQGRKRWVLFPPGAPREIIDPKPRDWDNEAASWFAFSYPRLQQPHPDSPANRSYAQVLGMIEFVQQPGETVFVPGGWAHAVMNLDFTVAVTHNYCSRTNFDMVWLKARVGRPQMAEKLKRVLDLARWQLDAAASNGAVTVPDPLLDTQICLGKRKRRQARELHVLKGKSVADLELYRSLSARIKQLETVPSWPASSSSSSSSSTSTSSSSSSGSSDGGGDSDNNGGGSDSRRELRKLCEEPGCLACSRKRARLHHSDRDRKQAVANGSNSD